VSRAPSRATFLRPERRSEPNYSKYLRRKFAELKFCAIMPARIQSAGRLRSTI
jgi:hypothetical protein